MEREYPYIEIAPYEKEEESADEFINLKGMSH